MSVHWGFYCRECNAESTRWFDDPRRLRRIYAKAGRNFRRVWGDQPLRLPTVEIEPLFFLAQHYGHEIWVQCELAHLKLGEEAESADEDDEEGARAEVAIPADAGDPPAKLNLSIAET